MIAEPFENNTSIEMIDSLGPDLSTEINSSNRLNTTGATPTSGRSHKAPMFHNSCDSEDLKLFKVRNRGK